MDPEVPYSPTPGGKFIKSVGKDYQGFKRGRKYHVRGEEYNLRKCKQYHLILRLLGRLSSGKGGKRTEFVNKNQD